MTIRKATVADVPIIFELISELALYEKAPDEVVTTQAQLEATLFAANPAVFCDLIEHEGQVAGMAIWFLSYSTWQGKHGVYLEDLFVREQFRGLGLGRKLLGHLAQICVDNDYGRLQWWVLDWNQPAIEFYRAHGAIAMDEWTVFRVAGDALGQLAKPN